MIQYLNLIDKTKSDIEYNIVNFNDGESHIKFTSEVNRKYDVHVVTRISSWNDLMLLMQIGDILNRMEVNFSVDINYLLTMRMDRVISFNEAYSLKIVANMINSIKPQYVAIHEPHSKKCLELINNSEAIHAIGIWRNMFTDTDKENVIFVFPDAGAKDRYSPWVSDEIPVVTCKKVRDPNTGQLLSFKIENPDVINNLPDGPDYRFVVIDDLCDNGGTFIGISNLLKKYPSIKRSIAVTHMVCENGIKNLSENYNDVYFTNSYKDWDVSGYENVHLIKIDNETRAAL